MTDEHSLTAEMDELEQAAAQRQQAFGAAIRQERINLGLTAEAAAEQAGVAYKTWLRVENGQPVRNITLSKVDKLFDLPKGSIAKAKIRHVSFEHLLTLKEAQLVRPTIRYYDKKPTSDPNAPKPLESPPAEVIELIKQLPLSQLYGLRSLIQGMILLQERPSYNEEDDLQTTVENHERAHLRMQEAEAELRESFSLKASNILIDHAIAQYMRTVGDYEMSSVANAQSMSRALQARRALEFLNSSQDNEGLERDDGER